MIWFHKLPTDCVSQRENCFIFTARIWLREVAFYLHPQYLTQQYIFPDLLVLRSATPTFCSEDMLTKHRCIPARSGMRHLVSHRRHASIWSHIGRAGIRSHTGAFAGIYRAVSYYKISIVVRNTNININSTCTKCQESSESECWSWTQHGRRRRFCGRIPRRLFAHSANWLYTCVMVWTMKLFAKCAWPQR